MRIAIIPARGGSKRIKNKNIIDFLGKPLISYALDAARESGLFDKIHVSTDSQEIRMVVEQLGYKIDFMRSEELADDYTGLMPVLKWVIEKYKKSGLIYDDIFCIMPAAPLLLPIDLVNANKIYEKYKKENPLLVVAPFSVPIEWAFIRDKNGILTPIDSDSLLIRSQDLTPVYFESGPFSIHHSLHVQNVGGNNKYVSYLIEKSRAVDIDDHEDLELAKILYLGKDALNRITNLT